ncbi:MAG: NADPH-dependent glutamate synthase [Dehalococcoidales bacterium]|jgi:glutamate synthase (NADPH/NADH) small chain|nr:NADPH-dependent glutamate synthase [Dehalococcoidales bacterium]MDP7286254.1 NADPH-dependent glutamate synthase [Dehalococcoidales bacterium]MDP7415726.1 NADPH-dependent glutamate synthase [Dehalococcoidales bacterium]
MVKLNLNRVEMPRQKPEVRAKNYNEVALGYNQEQAIEEARRCIQCPKYPCVAGCPVEIDIPGFILALRENRMEEAVKILKSKNALPGICGRVCPQETQCEVVCTLAKKEAPVAIGRLERYIADWERENMGAVAPEPVKPTGKKVAVVGSGPAGLTAAADLAMRGHRVTIFEALHIAGGVLMYGIPEFRLPKAIVQGEVDYVASLGVEIKLDSVVGRLVTIDELLGNGYDAVFLGTGAGLPMFMNVPKEHLNGIYSANEFLTRVNLMKAYMFPEYDTPVRIGRQVAVIGGGNVAMDSARCALRLGVEKVYIVYRRSEAELPARREEVENAQEEGIIFKLLTNPKRFLGDEQNNVVGMECYEMELGEPDESGRRRPIVKEGTEFTIDVDVVIVALGTTPNPLIAATTPGLEITKKGTVVADEATGKAAKDKVWAGGDIVTGAATVISAMGAARMAANDIDKYLGG